MISCFRDIAVNQLIPISDDLAKKIKTKLQAVFRLERPDDVAKTIAVAIAITEHFLGKSFCDRYIALSATPDPYMMNGFDDDAARPDRMIYQERVARLADCLFRLQHERGFDILIERFTTNRDMRSVNLEAYIAEHFKEGGFDIEILPLTGIRGQDFDFKAFGRPDTFNVEVTGCTNDRFSPKNLSNVLHNKRGQVPKTAPALLYCIIPHEWEILQPDLGIDLHCVTWDFYARYTKRINAVIYVLSRMIPLSGGGAAFADVFVPITNPDARFKPDLSFLFGDRVGLREELRAMQRSQNPPSKLDTLSYWPFVRDASPDSVG